STLAAANYQDVDLWDVTTGKERLSLPDHRGQVSQMVFSSDDKVLIAASRRCLDDDSYRSEVRLWDTATGKALATHQAPFPSLITLAVSPDDKVLAMVGTKGPHELEELVLVETMTGRELSRLGCPGLRVTPQFSPDGRFLAAGVGK